MKNILLAIVVMLGGLLSFPVFSQTENDEELLGLPGDNLDLFAVLNLFQKSKTIEDFEKSLNEEETGINNLDLNLDDKVDFIKVTTEQKDEDFTFILQVDVTEKEVQDVAVILLSKDKDDNVTLQIVGDKDLYGKNYVVEPQPPTPAVTPNPAYTGVDPVTETVPASTVIVVESAPVVQYVYSPVYVPYYPPYHYAYYPPYFRAATVIAVGVYRHNNYYHHHGYHGGHGNTIIINNSNNFNNYNNNRNRSNTVGHHNASGDYNKSGNRPTNSNVNRPSTSPSKPSASTRPSSPSASTRQSNPSASTRQANPSPSTRQSNPSMSTRPSTSSYGSGRSGGRSGGGYSGGRSSGRSGRGGRR